MQCPPGVFKRINTVYVLFVLTLHVVGSHYNYPDEAVLMRKSTHMINVVMPVKLATPYPLENEKLKGSISVLAKFNNAI